MLRPSRNVELSSLRGAGLLAAVGAVWFVWNLAYWSELLEPLPQPHGTIMGPVAWLALLGPIVGAGVRVGRIHPAGLVVLVVLVPLGASAAGYPQPSRFYEPFPAWFLDVPIAGILLVGWLVGWALRRAAVPVGAVLLALPLPFVAWAIDLHVDPVDRTPSHPLLVNMADGSFDGVRLGDPAGIVKRRLGPPPVVDPGGDIMPLRPGHWDDVSPPNFGIPSADVVLRYPHVAFTVHRGRVAIITITDPDAQTATGVGIGDSLQIARRTLVGFYCQYGSQTQQIECAGDLGWGSAWFGPDPIGSITLVADSYAR